jgi:hypothetical protein
MVSRVPCQAAFRSVPGMSSKAAAVRTGSCVYFRVTSFYPAAAVSNFRLISANWLDQASPPPGGQRAGMVPAGAGAGHGQRKLLVGAEPLGSSGIDTTAPGEAPQPLTLNHPALSPGCFSSRGSFVSGPSRSRGQVGAKIFLGSLLANFWRFDLLPGTRFGSEAFRPVGVCELLVRRGWVCGPFGTTPSPLICLRGPVCHSRPSTRSSRWTISALPLKPRIVAISADGRPLTFWASSTS